MLAGNPWQYRNRIRLALDGEGRVGYRARRSHDLVPISRVSDCRAAAGEGSADAGGDSQGSEAGISRRAEISLFSNADETEMLASILVRRLGLSGI